MTYAIIEIGGHQEKVTEGEIITSNKITGDVRDKFDFTPLLFVDDKKTAILPEDLKKHKVTLQIVDNFRGPKLHILRYKNKTRQHRKIGHRQELTHLEVLDVK